jgi:hypothetical protein
MAPWITSTPSQWMPLIIVSEALRWPEALMPLPPLFARA